MGNLNVRALQLADKDTKFSSWKPNLDKISPEIEFTFLIVKMIKYLIVTGCRATLKSKLNSLEVFKDPKAEYHTLKFNLLSKPGRIGSVGQYNKPLKNVMLQITQKVSDYRAIWSRCPRKTLRIGLKHAERAAFSL